MSIKVRKLGSDETIFVAGLGRPGPPGSGGTGGAYEAGEGIAITRTETGEAIQVKVPVKPLSRAEYDALSEEERQKAALYILTDEAPEGGSVPSGGTAGQILAKKSDADYDTAWTDPPEAGSGGSAGVASFNGRSGAVSPQTGDYTAEMVGARPEDWMPSAGDVGARPDTWMPSAAQVGAVPAGDVTAIQVLTQEQYDALSTRSSTRLYLIKE